MPEKIWSYYDAKGERVRKRRAIFAAKEVLVTAPERFGRVDVGGIAYRDVYLVTKPDDRREFTSKERMLQWFQEVAASGSRLRT